ncbi:UNVERIFIED_CONTAM: helicase associated domain (ha2) protein [Hammondia hammondi]|eukprot:XP_008885254.1 helicase associated domain (ha2) protein [Hammondia hammondi]
MAPPHSRRGRGDGPSRGRGDTRRDREGFSADAPLAAPADHAEANASADLHPPGVPGSGSVDPRPSTAPQGPCGHASRGRDTPLLPRGSASAAGARKGSARDGDHDREGPLPASSGVPSGVSTVPTGGGRSERVFPMARAFASGLTNRTSAGRGRGGGRAPGGSKRRFPEKTPDPGQAVRNGSEAQSSQLSTPSSLPSHTSVVPSVSGSQVPLEAQTGPPAVTPHAPARSAGPLAAGGSFSERSASSSKSSAPLTSFASSYFSMPPASETPAKGAMAPVEELPIMRYKEVILDHIREHSVTCIQGETGCGKSTRVPRFLLEEDLRRSRERREDPETPEGAVPRRLNAIVTQPRRLACIALARRVAQELEEPLGRNVGYRISGDAVTSKETKVCFVTTGYFLQVLINQPHALAALTHIILDEVHERDLDADLLSLVLKLQLSRKSSLKLIVMSATLQGNLFAEYFTPAGIPVSPRIYVGARRFPVQSLFLDDLLAATTRPESLHGKLLSPADLSGAGLLMEGRADEDVAGTSTGDAPGGMPHVNLVRALLQRKSARTLAAGWQTTKAIRDALSLFDRNSTAEQQRKGAGGGRMRGGPPAAQMRSGEGEPAGGWEAELQTSLLPQIMDGLDSVCLDLVTALGFGGETILIFLPGIGEITDLYETLSRLDSSTVWTGAASSSLADFDRRDSTTVSGAKGPGGLSDETSGRSDSLKYRIFVLHSAISREEQEEVFSPPASDTVHVVLASNIAESSLTLPQVRIVIDFCLKRQLIYDQRRHTAALVRAWTSHASSQQRTGRTGRVFPGLSIRLVSRQFYERCMRRFDPPEMQTAPLEKLYLTVKHLTHSLNCLALRDTDGEERQNAAAGDGRPGPHKGLQDAPGTTNEAISDRKLTPCQLLRLTVQPPDVSALDSARNLLNRLGALTSDSEDAEITNLGHLMMQLPIDTHLTKLLMVGIIAGCTSDALVLATVLASQDPFTMPSGLLIKHPAELAERLQLSLKSRAAYDAGHYSEPLMLRNLFVDWLTEFASSVAAVRSRLARQAAMRRNRRLEMNMKMEYLRVSRDFARGHSVVAKRMVHVAMMCVDLATRLKRLLRPDSAAATSLSFFVDLLQNPTIHPPAAAGASPSILGSTPPGAETTASASSSATASRFVYSTALTYSSSAAAAAVQERFSSDFLLLKSLLVAAFAPTFIVGKPRVCVDGKAVDRVVPRALASGAGKENSKWDLSDYAAAMLRQGLDPSRTLVLHDRLDSRTGTVFRQVRASLSLVCAGLDYSIVSCEGMEEKCFLFFPETRANACLTFDAARLPQIFKTLKEKLPNSTVVSSSGDSAAGVPHSSNRNNTQDQPLSGAVSKGAGADEDFGFRATTDKKAHEERMSKTEMVGSQVRVAGDEPGEREGGGGAANEEEEQTPVGRRTQAAATLSLAAHLPNQFANGRWKLSLALPETVETQQAEETLRRPGGTSGPLGGRGVSGTAGRFGAPSGYGGSGGKTSFSAANVEAGVQQFDMVRPCSPFVVSWLLMGDDESAATAAGEDAEAADSSAKSGKKKKDQGKKKVAKVKAVTNCRNPIGFYCACPVRVEEGGVQLYRQQEEVYGVVTVTQGTDDPQMCWVEGVTVLPQRHAALLMLAFLSHKHNVEIGLQVTTAGPVIKEISLFNGVRTMKLPFYEEGPTVTLADLWRINRVRRLLSEAFATPKGTAGRWGGDGDSRAGPSSGNAALAQMPSSDTVSISAVSVNMDASVRLGARSASGVGGPRGVGALPPKDEFEQINIDENAAVKEALVEMLRACNADVDTLALGNSPQDDCVKVLTTPGYLSCLTSNLGNAMKADLSLCRIPAFEETQSDLLAPFNLTGVADKVESVKSKAMGILQAKARAQQEAARREAEKRLAAAQKRKGAQTKANQKGGRTPQPPVYPMNSGYGRPEFNPYAGAEPAAVGGRREGKKGKGKNAAAQALHAAPQSSRRQQRQGASQPTVHGRRVEGAGTPPRFRTANLQEVGAPAYRRGAAPFRGTPAPQAAPELMATHNVAAAGMDANWHGYGAAAVAGPMAGTYAAVERQGYESACPYPQPQEHAQQYLHPRGVLQQLGAASVGANAAAYGVTPAVYASQRNYQVHQNASNVCAGGYQAFGQHLGPTVGRAAQTTLTHGYPPVGQFVGGSQYDFSGSRSVAPGYQQDYRCPVVPSYGARGAKEAEALQRPGVLQADGAGSFFPGTVPGAGRELMQNMQTMQNLQNVRRYAGGGFQ